MSGMTISPVIDQVLNRETGQLLPAKVAEMLSLSLEDLAALLDVTRTALTQSPGDPQVQGNLGLIVRIVALAASLGGDPPDAGEAVLWFRRHRIAAFGGLTAEDLVRQRHAAAVLEHLEALADGGYA